jgi:hypothetical protein
MRPQQAATPISASRDAPRRDALTNGAAIPFCETAPNRLICIHDDISPQGWKTTPIRRSVVRARRHVQPN